MRTFIVLRAISVAISLLFFTVLANSQDSSQQKGENESTIEGTVVSTSRQTMVVRTDNNEFHLFVYDRYTNRPKTVAVGTRVRVVSKPGDEEGTRLAGTITALETAPNTTSSTASGGSTETRAASPPPAVRDLESNIKNEARRWHLGVRAGAALDPELFMFGVHSQIGPIFNRNVFFRPNAEFAFGEVTDLIALNLEAIYRLPVTARGKNWSAYVGGGPALTFIHQNFEREQGQGKDIDFGNFDYETGFNILTGVQRRHTFFEIKTSLYSRPAPTLRLIFGYTF
jgi:hypothetical protein